MNMSLPSYLGGSPVSMSSLSFPLPIKKQLVPSKVAASVQKLGVKFITWVLARHMDDVRC